jgi:serine/threonine protein kinase
LIQGQSLQDLLQNKIGLEFPRVMRIAIQVADALAAVHEAGIIHRDLKPGNILLVERRGSPDFVKLVDFGISKSQTLDADEWGSKTAPGMLIGSPGYMAPEQALGLDLDHRCDIYAFGVLLYQMVTGELLFHGNSWADVLVQHANRPPPPPSALRTDLPAQFEAIILSCLAKNKDERPNTAADLAEQLRLLRDVFWPEVSSMVQSSDCLPIPGLAPDHHGRSWHTNFVRLHKSASAAIGIGTAAFFLAFGVVLALALPAPRSGERGAAASFSEVLSRAAAAPVAALAPPSNAPAAPAQNNAKDADRSAEGNDETAKNLKGNVARDKAASPKSTKLNLRSSAVFKKKPTRTTEAKWVKGKAAARDAESTPEPATDAASEGDTPAQALKRAAQLVRSGYTAQAIQITLEVLREQPKNAQAYRVLGIAYSLRGSTTAACEAYRRYLRNMPEAPDRDKVQEILTACP